MNVRETGIPYASILPIFKEHKRELRTNIRYKPYRKNEASREFLRILGPDIGFASHPGVTYNLARRFIAQQNYIFDPNQRVSQSEETRLCTAAIVHDLGELKIDGFGVGDVTFEAHGANHEEMEQAVFALVTESIVSETDRDFIRSAYQEIALNRNTKLGRMFNAVERIGYLNTAIRAFNGYKGKRIANWKGLVGNVLSNQTEALLVYATEYPYVQKILQANSSFITQAFEELINIRVPPDRKGKPLFNREKLVSAANAWGLTI